MYESYWELAEPPFDNSPNPKFFYMSPEHEEALGRLRLRQDHLVARPHPAARGRALRDRPAHQPELDAGRFSARGALPAGGRDAGDAQAGALASPQRPVLPQLSGRS